MGDNMEAIPTPIPATNLAAIKKSLLGAKDMRREEMPNTAAANNKPGLLPFLSAILPAIMQPAIAPNARLAVAKPS